MGETTLILQRIRVDAPSWKEIEHQDPLPYGRGDYGRGDNKRKIAFIGCTKEYTSAKNIADYTAGQAGYPEVTFWEWHRVYVNSHPVLPTVRFL